MELIEVFPAVMFVIARFFSCGEGTLLSLSCSLQRRLPRWLFRFGIRIIACQAHPEVERSSTGRMAWSTGQAP